MWFIFPWSFYKILMAISGKVALPKSTKDDFISGHTSMLFCAFFSHDWSLDKSHIKANLIFPLYILCSRTFIIKICSNFCSLLLQVCITKQTIQFGRKQLKKLVYISIQKYAWEKWKFAVDGEVYFLTEKIDFPALTYSV